MGSVGSVEVWEERGVSGMKGDFLRVPPTPYTPHPRPHTPHPRPYLKAIAIER
ncbi:MAG: hypothetical protein F6J93_05910 [Oscillatoria sp. SIO1A7]|nr:hypothetical protein [Oscillatoria sp. SIO1A7]